MCSQQQRKNNGQTLNDCGQVGGLSYHTRTHTRATLLPKVHVSIHICRERLLIDLTINKWLNQVPQLDPRPLSPLNAAPAATSSAAAAATPEDPASAKTTTNTTAEKIEHGQQQDVAPCGEAEIDETEKTELELNYEGKGNTIILSKNMYYYKKWW